MSKNELPDSWINNRIIDITYLLNGFAFKSANYVNDGIRVIRITNVQRGLIVDDDPKYYPKSTYNEIEKYILQENDLLISLTGNVGRVGILSNKFLPAALNQRVSCLRLKDEKIANTKFLYYFLQQNSFEKDCIKASKGVAQLNLSTLWLEQYSIPLAPLPEQERIVSKIEELFSELDKGVENLQTIKQQLKVYRQAVLKDAFEGKFVPNCNVSSIALKDLVISNSGLRRGPFGSAIKKSFFVESGYKVYEQGNAINNDPYRGKYFIDESKYLELKNFQIQPLDLLVSCSGVTLGRIVELPSDVAPGVINQALLRIRLNRDLIRNDYFIHYFRSEIFQRLIFEKSQGTAMPNLVSIKEFKEIHLNVPKVEEQEQVVLAIESRLSVCDKIEQTVDETLQKAESLRQSILKKAFEGKLVEQNRSNEPTEML